MDFRSKWLSEQGNRLSIPGLAFDEEGVCQLSIDNDMVVIIHKPTEPDNLILFGQLPVHNLTIDTMQLMLAKNHNHSMLSAATMSLSENHSKIQIQLELTQLELDTAGDIIGDLLETLDYWRTHLCNT